MTDLTESAHSFLAGQHGVASLAQLLESGLTARQIEHLVQRGALINLCRAAYRSPSIRPTERTWCAAVCLAHDGVVIGGPTAGRLWGFRRMAADRRVHAIAPLGQRSPIGSNIVLHRTELIRPGDVVERDDGIRVLDRARTAIDLARFLRGDDLVSVIEQAIAQTPQHWHHRFEVPASWARHRPWVQTYLAALRQRISGPGAESHAEVRVGVALSRSGVEGLVRQHSIELPDHGPARFDLAVPPLRWAVEIDVFPTHAEPAGALDDARRDRAAAQIGWRVTRVSASDYEHRFDETIARVTDEFRQRRSEFLAADRSDPTSNDAA